MDNRRPSTGNTTKLVIACVLLIAIAVTTGIGGSMNNPRGISHWVSDVPPAEELIVFMMTRIASSLALLVLLCKFVAWALVEVSRALGDITDAAKGTFQKTSDWARSDDGAQETKRMSGNG